MENTAAISRRELADHDKEKGRELVEYVREVAREKGIDEDEVLTAMKEAIKKAGRYKYGDNHDLRAEIDGKTGAIALYRYMEVVADGSAVENEDAQFPLADAVKKDPSLKVGDFWKDPNPLSVDFGRVAAQTAKQVISQKIREAERIRQYNEYKDRVGCLINGIVKRVESNNSVIVDIGHAEAVLRWDELIRRETFQPNDRIRAYLSEVRLEPRGPQILLSRTHPQFLAKLFEQEVPEIYDGIIEIKAVARAPGSRAKMAVTASDSSLDPVGACVGPRGNRVQAVVSELQGEKIDIIQWSPDPAEFAISALAPATVSQVVLDEENHQMEVIVADDQKSLAIGAGGQNVRLATQLMHWKIDILTEDEYNERRQSEFKIRTELFRSALDVDDIIAQLLVAEGFTDVAQVAFVQLDEIENIEGFDHDLAVELQSRARAYIERKNEEFAVRIKELGVDSSLLGFDGLTQDAIMKLGENGVKTLTDFADLATDELLEYVGENMMPKHEAEALIMKARELCFDENGNPKA